MTMKGTPDVSPDPDDTQYECHGDDRDESPDREALVEWQAGGLRSCRACLACFVRVGSLVRLRHLDLLL